MFKLYLIAILLLTTTVLCGTNWGALLRDSRQLSLKDYANVKVNTDLYKQKLKQAAWGNVKFVGEKQNMPAIPTHLTPRFDKDYVKMMEEWGVITYRHKRTTSNATAQDTSCGCDTLLETASNLTECIGAECYTLYTAEVDMPKEAGKGTCIRYVEHVYNSTIQIKVCNTANDLRIPLLLLYDAYHMTVAQLDYWCCWGGLLCNGGCSSAEAMCPGDLNDPFCVGFTAQLTPIGVGCGAQREGTIYARYGFTYGNPWRVYSIGTDSLEEVVELAMEVYNVTGDAVIGRVKSVGDKLAVGFKYGDIPGYNVSVETKNWETHIDTFDGVYATFQVSDPTKVYLLSSDLFSPPNLPSEHRFGWYQRNATGNLNDIFDNFRASVINNVTYAKDSNGLFECGHKTTDLPGLTISLPIITAGATERISVTVPKITNEPTIFQDPNIRTPDTFEPGSFLMIIRDQQPFNGEAQFADFTLESINVLGPVTSQDKTFQVIVEVKNIATHAGMVRFFARGSTKSQELGNREIGASTTSAEQFAVLNEAFYTFTDSAGNRIVQICGFVQELITQVEKCINGTVGESKFNAPPNEVTPQTVGGGVSSSSSQQKGHLNPSIAWIFVIIGIVLIAGAVLIIYYIYRNKDKALG